MMEVNLVICCILFYIVKLLDFAGSNGLGTLLVVTGTGFSHENASIYVGESKCHVEEITSKSITSIVN